MSIGLRGRAAVGEQHVGPADQLGSTAAMHILDLEGDRLQGGAGELRQAGAEGEPGDQPDRVVDPTTARRAR